MVSEQIRNIARAEASALIATLPASSTTPLVKNEVTNPNFTNGTGWAASGGTATYVGGVATFSGTGDIRQSLRAFTADDTKMVITCEVKSPTTAKGVRHFMTFGNNDFFSTVGVVGVWTTVTYTVNVVSGMVGQTQILMLQCENGTQYRNIKLFYNNDVDTLYKDVKAYTDAEVLRTKFFRPGFEGKKLVTLGDSITAQTSWQPTVATCTGMVFNQIENTFGTNGNAPTGMGSSTIIPQVEATTGRQAGNSIYMRADAVKFYNPDVIILMGGQNDGLDVAYPTYDISVAAWTGGEFPIGSASLPSFVAAYKGTLKKLTEQNPLAKIYAMTTMYNYTSEISHSELLKYITRRNLIRDLCDLYGVTFIDNLVGTGMHWYNNATFSPAVHPSAAGGVRLGELVARRL
jgi:lysophospholipase L1-like esterase